MSGEGIVSPSDHEEPWFSQRLPFPTQHTDASSLFSSTPFQQAIPLPTYGLRNAQESQFPSTSTSNSRYSRGELTPAQLSQVFLHSSRSRAERQQETWDTILQYLCSQVTVEKELIGLLKERKAEILCLRRKIRRHEESGWSVYNGAFHSSLARTRRDQGSQWSDRSSLGGTTRR